MFRKIFHLSKREQKIWLSIVMFLFVASQLVSFIRINRTPINNERLVQLITEHHKLYYSLKTYQFSDKKENGMVSNQIINYNKAVASFIEPNKHPQYFLAINHLQHAIHQQDSTHKSSSILKNCLKDFDKALLQTINELQNPRISFNQSNISSLAFTQIAITLLAVIITAWYTDESHRVDRLKENYKLNNETFDLLLENKSLLKLHQIHPEELKKHKISIEEFVYILKSFNSLSAYYTMRTAQEINFTDYRQHFLNSPKVKITWQRFIKHKFISFKNVIDAVDKYYSEPTNVKE